MGVYTSTHTYLVLIGEELSKLLAGASIPETSYQVSYSSMHELLASYQEDYNTAEHQPVVPHTSSTRTVFVQHQKAELTAQ